MPESKSSKFNIVLSQIIKKSLFTERQIEIILNQRNLERAKFPITRGAYYRQVSQSKKKLAGLYYSIILLRGLGVFLSDDVDVISKLSEHVSVIKNRDDLGGNEAHILDVIDRAIGEVSRA